MVGGYTGSTRLSSTEILVGGSGSWRLASSLPRRMWGLRTVSVDNSVLTFGKFQIKILGLLMSSGE